MTTNPPLYVGPHIEGGLRCPALSCDAPLVRVYPGSLRSSEWEVLLSCAGDAKRGGVRHVSYLTLSSSDGRVRHSLSTHEIASGSGVGVLQGNSQEATQEATREEGT